MMKRRPVPRLRDQSLNRLIPNMLTVMALCAGLTSIRYTLDQRWELAAIAIVIAGVPAPAGAGLALLPIFAPLELGPGLVDRPVVVGPFMLLVAGLLISRLPTYSFKRIKVPHRHVGIALLAVGAAVAFLVSTPWI